jgi:tRNA(adenine34) deaminase
MKKEITIKELQKVETDGFIRLFKYMEEVGKLIGRDKALQILEDVTARKRLEWLSKNKNRLNLEGNILEKAYNVFYQEYLGLTPDDLEIVEKSERRLVIRSRNYCPVLEACKALGLERFDTREICKKVYERPVQIFLEQISPRIRFSRNYDRIRPYAEYCEEIMELED